MVNYTRQGIRKEARSAIKGNVISLFGANLLVQLLLGLVVFAKDYPIISVAIFLLTSVLEFGLAMFYLNYIGEGHINYKHIYISYRGGYKIFIKHMMTFILKYVIILFNASLLLIPGLIKRYSYSQVKYLRAEYPEIGPIKCLLLSKRMMRWRKYELFVLDLSLIIWFILIPLTGGLILIYFQPYYSAIMAKYHLHLKSIRYMNIDINRGLVSYFVYYLYRMS